MAGRGCEACQEGREQSGDPAGGQEAILEDREWSTAVPVDRR